MSEQITYEECIYDAAERQWWYAPNGLNRDGVGETVVDYDPHDGTRLNEDGTVTKMLPMVPAGAVQETALWELLSDANGPQTVGEMARVGARLFGVGLSSRDAVLTDDGTIVLAALSQATGAVTDELAARKLRSESIKLAKIAENIIAALSAQTEGSERVE